MTTSLDLATALDHVLGDPNTEAKFQALKTLHAKKIKSLMSCIDAKEREVDRLKALGKDNRRTEIIQSLKKKLKHHELVIHVLKQEMVKQRSAEWESGDGDGGDRVSECVSVEVNNFIIGKTISGPKRFRPLIREELENRIIELEKKLRSKLTGAVASERVSERVSGGGGGGGGGGVKGKGTLKSGKISTRGNATGGISVSEGVSERVSDGVVKRSVGEEELRNMIDISELQDHITSLNHEITNRDNIITKQKEEMCRIRVSNTTLHTLEEELDTLDRSYKELTLLHHRTIEDLEDSTHQLSLSREEKFQIQANMEQELEQAHSLTDTLREQCEQGLKQNTQLLRLMSNLEVKMIEASNGHVSTSTTKSTGGRHVSPAKHNNTVSETEYVCLVDKLKSATTRIHELESGAVSSDAALLALKETLREKNEMIRELKRNISEITRHNTVASNGVATSNGVRSAMSASNSQEKNTSLPLSNIAESKSGGNKSTSTTTTPRDSKGSKSSSPRP